MLLITNLNTFKLVNILIWIFFFENMFPEGVLHIISRNSAMFIEVYQVLKMSWKFNRLLVI